MIYKLPKGGWGGGGGEGGLEEVGGGQGRGAGGVLSNGHLIV